MIFLEEITKIYADKLIKTLSHQDAFRKAVWVAYKRGIEDANVDVGLPQTEEPSAIAHGCPCCMDRELIPTQLHTPVCAVVPAMGRQASLERFRSNNACFKHIYWYSTQPRPRDTLDTSFSLRAYRPRELTGSTTGGQPKQG